MKKVKYFTNIDSEIVRCELCPHRCELKKGKVGVCNVRKNVEGELLALNYGKFVSISIDPIEKKPLYHFYPGEKILSVASYGCNFKCDWCQNWAISQEVPSYEEYSVNDLIEMINNKELKMIAFTYSEPLMWYEYIYDFARKIKSSKPDFKIVLVSNGYINKKPLLDLVEYIDGFNLDIKGMSNDVYKKYIGGSLEPVLETAKILYNHDVHIEITDLLVTDINDSEKDVENLSKWIVENFDDGIPLHLSRYYPNYQMKNKATPEKRILTGYKIAKKYLKYVYVGNIMLDDKFINTYCPNCGNLIIERYYTRIKIRGLTGELKCSNCGQKLNIEDGI